MDKGIGKVRGFGTVKVVEEVIEEGERTGSIQISLELAWEGVEDDIVRVERR